MIEHSPKILASEEKATTLINDGSPLGGRGFCSRVFNTFDSHESAIRDCAFDTSSYAYKTLDKALQRETVSSSVGPSNCKTQLLRRIIYLHGSPAVPRIP